MTVHINGSKGKELYYNGVKIKEAYYNGNKVYSSEPLYFCYLGNGTKYIYFRGEKVLSPDRYLVYRTLYWGEASSSSYLDVSATINITSVSSDSFVYNGVTYNYYSSGNLYT